MKCCMCMSSCSCKASLMPRPSRALTQAHTRVWAQDYQSVHFYIDLWVSGWILIGIACLQGALNFVERLQEDKPLLMHV